MNSYELGRMGGDDQTRYLNEIRAIQDATRTFNDNVSAISNLRNRSLDMYGNDAGKDDSEIQRLVDETNTLGNDLRRRIQDLERAGRGGGDTQTAFVKSKFVEAIQNYQQAERQYRERYRQRIERQFKIVKPDATNEELRAVVESDRGDQIFSQALMNSTSYDSARAGYREVQARHLEIKKIEQTLSELYQLTQDLAVIVEKQGEDVDRIQKSAVQIDNDVEKGDVQLGKAVESARSWRRLRWYGLVITIIIILVVVLAVVLTIRNQMSK